MQIQRLDHFAGGQHSEGLFFKGVKPSHQSTRVGVATKPVKAGQQCLAVGQTIQRDAIECHVGFRIPFRMERAMGNAKEAGCRRVVRAMLHLRLQTNVRWNRRIGCTLQFRNDRTKRRPTPGRLVARDVPGHAMKIRMLINHADDRPDRRQFVHHARHARQQLADPRSGHIRCDRMVDAADFFRRLGFEIEAIELR